MGDRRIQDNHRDRAGELHRHGEHVGVGQCATGVSLTSPGNGASYYAPATIPLSASASDGDGYISSVAYYVNGIPLATVTSAPYKFTWASVGNGSFAFTAVATDNQGAVTTSAPIGVTVGTPPSATVMSVGVSPNPVGVGQWATVTVSGTNPCGALQINFGDGNAPYLPISQLPYSIAYWWGTPGTYTISATGHANCSGTASTTVTVVGGPEPAAGNTPEETAGQVTQPPDPDAHFSSAALETGEPDWLENTGSFEEPLSGPRVVDESCARLRKQAPRLRP